MAVQDIECQIAKGQIERYLSGAPFSGEALQQLEEHIAECQACKQLLSSRKAVLLSMLGHANAVVHDTERADRPSTVAAALRWTKKPKAKPESVPTPAGPLKAGQFTKPLIYCSLLAAVLMGMSYYSRTLTKPFGNHVIETDAEPTATATEEPAPAPKPTIIPVYTDSKPAPILTQPAPPLTVTNQPKPTPTQANPVDAKRAAVPTAATNKPIPGGTSASMSSGRPAETLPGGTSSSMSSGRAAETTEAVATKPKPAAKPAPKKVAKRAPKRTTRIKPAKHATGGVRVYDPQGNLLPAR